MQKGKRKEDLNPADNRTSGINIYTDILTNFLHFRKMMDFNELYKHIYSEYIIYHIVKSRKSTLKELLLKAISYNEKRRTSNNLLRFCLLTPKLFLALILNGIWLSFHNSVIVYIPQNDPEIELLRNLFCCHDWVS